MSESQAEPTPEELVEELRKIKVGDLLVSLGLDARVARLREARAGAARPRAGARSRSTRCAPSLPLIPEEHRRDIQQVVANLQLAYAATPPKERLNLRLVASRLCYIIARAGSCPALTL